MSRSRQFGRVAMSRVPQGEHRSGTARSPGQLVRSRTASCLHKRYPVETLEEALAEGITAGHSKMPEFKFEAKQVDEIIDYLKTLER